MVNTIRMPATGLTGGGGVLDLWTRSGKRKRVFGSKEDILSIQPAPYVSEIPHWWPVPEEEGEVPAEDAETLAATVEDLVRRVAHLEQEMLKARDSQRQLLEDIHGIVLAISQAYFWSREWQEGEARVDEQIQRREVKGPFSASALVKHLRQRYG